MLKEQYTLLEFWENINLYGISWQFETPNQSPIDKLIFFDIPNESLKASLRAFVVQRYFPINQQ